MGLFNEVREDVVWESVLWFDGGIGMELVSSVFSSNTRVECMEMKSRHHGRVGQTM
jgi:hypothetical protein